jgi:acetyl esterase/lipase
MRQKAPELGLKNAKVGILGFSAGGHLATMTATRWRDGSAESADSVEKQSSRPDFACLIYPVVSFMEHGHGGSRGNLLGDDATPENRKTYSGEFNVTKNTPPIFMVHANDDGVKVENSFVFYQALHKQGIPAELHIVSRGAHGFFNGKGWGLPGKDDLRFTRSGGMWPVWTLNWMQEEKLVSGDWQWPKTREAVKKVVDP